MKYEGSTEMRKMLALGEADNKIVILRKYKVTIWEINKVNVGEKEKKKR